MPIPLNKLPSHVIDKILQKADMTDLVSFSLVPSHFSREALSKVQPKEWVKLRVHLEAKTKTITIQKPGKEGLVMWDFSPNDWNGYGKDVQCQTSERIVNAVKVKDGIYHTRIMRNSDSKFGALVSHFTSVFPHASVRVYMDDYEGDNLVTLIGCLKNVDKFEITGKMPQFNYESRDLLVRLNVFKSFRIRCNFIEDVFLPPALTWNCDDVEISPASTLQPQHLMTLECATAQFRFAGITEEPLVEYVKKWMNSDDGRLQYLAIQLRSDIFPLNLAGIEAKEWDPEMRGRYYKFANKTCLDCHRGMDIVRKSDGILATIVINESWFHFVVWHDRFPEDTDKLPTTLSTR